MSVLLKLPLGAPLCPYAKTHATTLALVPQTRHRVIHLPRELSVREHRRLRATIRLLAPGPPPMLSHLAGKRVM
jgi:hypothetical protein